MTAEMTAEQLIRALEMSPHPEGGHYKEVFRSSRTVIASDLGSRSASTAIYFLLRSHERSTLHRVRSDEVWHHYRGAPLELVWLSSRGEYNRVVLGPNIIAGQRPQAVVPQDCWQAARPIPGDLDYSLVGCTVSPGFEFADFELPSREELLKLLPLHEELVRQFTSD